MLLNQSPLVNGGNAVGNMNANGGSLTATTGGVANARNEAFGSTGGSANVMNAGNKGLYDIKGGATSPSSAHRPLLLLLKVKVAVVEDEEEAKLRAEAEKIDILAAVNTDANVLPRLAPALVPAAVDMPSI